MRDVVCEIVFFSFVSPSTALTCERLRPGDLVVEIIPVAHLLLRHIILDIAVVGDLLLT